MYVKIVLLSLLAVCIQHMVVVIYHLGFHKTVYNHQPGPCRIVPGVEYGSEQIQTSSKGLAFITSGMILPQTPDWVRQIYEKNGVEGKIFLFDFNHPDENVTDLPFNPEFDRSTFIPHGMSLYENKETDQIILFVVNHFPGTDTVEKFEFIEDEKRLHHLHTYVDASIMHYVNDVAATGENSFYFTNSGYFRDHLSHLLEVVFYLPFGNVMYFDGKTYRTVVDGLVFPNGIATSLDFRTVYVASTTTLMITIYRREEDDSLEQVQELLVYSQPDNINVEPVSGNLLIGLHPVGHKIGHHLHEPEVSAPSQVLMTHMKNDSYAEKMTELYSDDGHLLYGSSSATIHSNQMLIGSVITKLLYCEVRVLDSYSDSVPSNDVPGKAPPKH